MYIHTLIPLFLNVNFSLTNSVGEKVLFTVGWSFVAVANGNLIEPLLGLNVVNVYLWKLYVTI